MAILYTQMRPCPLSAELAARYSNAKALSGYSFGISFFSDLQKCSLFWPQNYRCHEALKIDCAVFSNWLSYEQYSPTIAHVKPLCVNTSPMGEILPSPERTSVDTSRGEYIHHDTINGNTQTDQVRERSGVACRAKQGPPSPPPGVLQS